MKCLSLPLRKLTVIDEYSRECLAIEVARELISDDFLETLTGLFAVHGPPDYLRFDSGPALTAKVVRDWLRDLGAKALFIEHGSPWGNGYIESFNGPLREEVLNREIFFRVAEAKVLIEQWRREYDTIRPHSSLGYRPPVPETIRPEPAFLSRPTLRGPHLPEEWEGVRQWMVPQAGESHAPHWNLMAEARC